MKLSVIICVFVCSVAVVVAAPQRPLYSLQYASVYYQGSGREKHSQTTEIESESKQIKDNKLEGLKEEAVYYIYHPEGLLQRVVYLQRDNPENMEFIAQLKYETIKPIQDPIFSYNPETLELYRLQK